MKTKKIIIFLILLFTLTGCNINYNINVNEDLTIDENITVESTKSEFIENEIEDFKKIKKEYNYSEENSNNKIISKFEKKGNKLIEFLNSDYVKRYLGNVKITDKKNYEVFISFNDTFKDELFGSSRFANSIDEFNLKLQMPYEIIKGNYSNKIGNTYIWNFNHDSDSSVIYFVFENPFYLRKTIVPIILIIVFTAITILVFIKYKKNNEF